MVLPVFEEFELLVESVDPPLFEEELDEFDEEFEESVDPPVLDELESVEVPVEESVVPDCEPLEVPVPLEESVLVEPLVPEPVEESFLVPVPLEESLLVLLVPVDESVVAESLELSLPFDSVVLLSPFWFGPGAGGFESSWEGTVVVGVTRLRTTESVPLPCVISITMPAVTATAIRPDTSVTMMAVRFGLRERDLRSSLTE